MDASKPNSRRGKSADGRTVRQNVLRATAVSEAKLAAEALQEIDSDSSPEEIRELLEEAAAVVDVAQLVAEEIEDEEDGER